MRSVLFVDRDGTLVEEPADEQVDAIDKVRLLPGVIPALLELSEAGYELVMVSNQDGLGTDSFPLDDFRQPHDFIVELFASQGVRFAQEYICPHLPDAGCACRKPATGLVADYLDTAGVDLDASFVIGDRETDLEFARNLGVRGFQLSESMGWAAIAGEILHRPRLAVVKRATSETTVELSLELDRPGPNTIKTGIAFFDHMLDQLALHAGFSMQLDCDGDTEIDDHHTVEDVALTLGQALDEALATRRGIGRYGFLLPMDESLAQVAIDLSGRPHCSFEAQFSRPMVGQLATEMVPHFFRSLAQSLRAAIHISVTGENTHHQIEAIFKAVGRSLRPALAVSGNTVPSSKGLL